MADERDDILEDGDYEAAFNEAADNDDSWQEPPADGEVTEEPVVETQPTEETPEPKTSPEVEQIEQKLANMEKLLAEAAKRAEPQAPAKAQAPTADDEEDAAALKEAAEDWPTLTRAMEVRIRQLEAKLAQALGQVETRLKGELAPMSRVVAETAQDKFLTTIHSVHPDANTLLPEAEKWIATQPKFLQAAYNAALDNGTAQDVIEFYSTFKQATGRVQDQATDAPPQPNKREQRLRQMEGVRAERTSATAISDDDFEGAFERAARSN